ncbi:Lar family restriction alleviation protein [Massiliimalia timonensis]|uniref:Lar family restriction alleviation protein n=1 Tax=Massiliimalia timonensis TaxID=1987501 RepID=UPI0012B9D432
MKANKLFSCPFCGGQAELKKVNVYGRDGYRVTCTKCHCSTNLISTGINLLNNEEITVMAAKNYAVSLWQTRTSG